MASAFSKGLLGHSMLVLADCEAGCPIGPPTPTHHNSNATGLTRQRYRWKSVKEKLILAKDSFTSLAKSFVIVMTEDFAKVERSRLGNISKEKWLDLVFGFPAELSKPFGPSEFVVAKNGFSKWIVERVRSLSVHVVFGVMHAEMKKRPNDFRCVERHRRHRKLLGVNLCWDETSFRFYMPVAAVRILLFGFSFEDKQVEDKVAIEGKADDQPAAETCNDDPVAVLGNLPSCKRRKMRRGGPTYIVQAM